MGRIQQYRKTAANWTADDPILLVGEMGVETDTVNIKFGDGVTAWSGLAYFAGTGIGAVVEDLTPQLGGDLDANSQTITGLDASTTAKGIIEIATAAETTTGTDATRAITPDGFAGSDFGKKTVDIMLLDNDTANEVIDGAGAVYWTVPESLNGYNIVAVQADVSVAGTTGTQDIQIHNLTAAADILSTKMTIDTTETSTTTAATPAVINTAEDDLTTADQIRFDVDVIQTTAAKGLAIKLTVQLP